MMKEFEDLFEYNNDFDESIFEVRYTNSKSNKSARILKQIKICDDNMNWYNTGYDYEPVLKNYISWGERHKNVGISFVFPFVFIVDIINFFINHESYPDGLSLSNSIKSKQSQGKPDIWKLKETDTVYHNKKLYHFTITRGGNQDFNVDMYLNLHTIRCIVKTLKNYYLSEKTKRIVNSTQKKIVSNVKLNAVPNPLIPKRELRDFSEFYYSPDLHKYLTESSNFCKWIVDNKKTECVNMTVVPRYFADKFRINEEDTVKKLNQLRDEYLSRIN